MCVWGILIKTGKQFTNDFSKTKVHQDQISLNNLFVLIIDGRLKPHQGQLIFFFRFQIFIRNSQLLCVKRLLSAINPIEWFL